MKRKFLYLECDIKKYKNLKKRKIDEVRIKKISNLLKRHNFESYKFLLLIAPYYIFTKKDYVKFILLNKKLRKEVPKMVEMFKSNYLPQNINCSIISMKIYCKMKFGVSKWQNLLLKSKSSKRIIEIDQYFDMCSKNIKTLHLYDTDSMYSSLSCNCITKTDRVISTLTFLKKSNKLKTLILQGICVTSATISNYSNKYLKYIIFIDCMISDINLYHKSDLSLSGKKMVFIRCSVSGGFKNTLIIQNNKKNIVFDFYKEKNQKKMSFFYQNINNVMIVVIKNKNINANINVKIKKNKVCLKNKIGKLQTKNRNFLNYKPKIINYLNAKKEVSLLPKIETVKEFINQDLFNELKIATYLCFQSFKYREYNKTLDEIQFAVFG